MQDNSAINYAKSPLEGVRILSCQGKHQFEKHLHDDYVIWLNSSACEYYSLRGSSYLLEPGCISIIEPGMIHTNHSTEQLASHLRSFYISEKWIQDLVYTCSEKVNCHQAKTVEVNDRFIWLELIKLHDRLLAAQDYLEIECNLMSVFVDLFKRLGCLVPDAANPLGRKLIMAKEYMHAHLSVNISLDDLAEIAGCSSYHLIRLFRKEMNITPHAYLVQLRLERARQHLDHGKSIIDAAFLSGFADQSHLTRKFKVRYGISPGRYLQQNSF